MGFVGKPLPRFEDDVILRGKARYVDDVDLPGMLYAGFVRSPYAHARVLKVDLSDVAGHPGVVAVFGPGGGFDFAPGGKVRYQGEAVAMVVARDRYVLYDALEKASVDYEPLPAVVDVYEALKPGAPLVDESLGSNVVYERVYTGGDVERAFREADVVVEGRFSIQRLVPSAMETRGVVASYDGETLTVWSSTQVPFDIRKEVAKALGLPLAKVRVIQPHVGGAFGSKLLVYPEELWVARAAYVLRAPVKWVATRTEDFRATTHGRGLVLEYRAGARRDGRILAVEGVVYEDAGAYYWGEGLADTAARMLPGPYDIRHGRVKAVAVLTNKTPLSAYRGAGRPEATLFIERIVDHVADELGIDRVEIRRRNLVRQLPYTNVFGITYDTGDYPATFERGLERLGYHQLRKWAEEEARRGRLLGVGLSVYVEITTFGYETAILRAEEDGSFTLYTALTPHGQGLATALAQVVADELEVSPEAVKVYWGDTAYIGDGIGTMGSRSITAGGSAAIQAARKLKAELAKAAEKLLGCRPEYGGGKFRCGGREISIGDVVKAVYRGKAEAQLTVESIYHAEPTFPFGVHVAVVELDPETGFVKPILYRSYDDVGVVVNPLLAAGQVMGGALQGIAQALYEEVVYDGDGNLVTSNLAFYHVPTAAEAPRFEVHFAEEPHPSKHPTGTKGIGEAATIASTPAVVAAVEDAIRRVKPGVRISKTPVSPEDIWRMLR
ncbi:glyceraldehyde dehydrogenase subunit alpha [Pyrobaculum neutrophilum]|uniref:Aldehyde oxidase and xanthine dehydrogenase molybdopterin binding n=1 Tax=Pyrobaculum neutrophilum (strain DSM 2338 / JCM 9278 / NBRC 100436 / V24Sta) TaxID=444157 RepID=B1YD71_PYRNV|nr:glyceraldehyde dehydrogenase subunit alpha [Pyrobaculum neutrophilum]ACB39734.1 aldehyde oxidase and xanthine dehydrogenase molybdopterin binding [Pyrobaculum neutrophilum V24Sta]